MKQSFFKYIKSLRFRICILVFAVGVLPVIAFAGGFLKLYEQRSISSNVQDLTSQAQLLNNQIITSGYMNDTQIESVNTQLQALTKVYSGRIMVINSSLKIIKDTYALDEGKIFVWENVTKSAKGETLSYYDKKNHNISVTVPIVPASEDGEIIGVLLINKSMESMVLSLSFFKYVTTVVTLVAIILILFFAIFFSNHFTKPFHKISAKLSQAQNGMAQGDLVVSDYTEMEELTEQFNDLISRMQAIDDSRQEFVSNVSHELKTPLTSMKVLADSINSMEGAPVELYQEFMVDIGNEIERETKIINDLLSMVKMDKTDAGVNIAPVNINELVEMILKRLRPIAEKNEVDIVLESFRPITAEVDEVKLSLAISNLVENGIKYNHPGGFVHVTLNADHQYFYLQVDDSGMGIPEESIEHIFDRFYRVDKSHSREIGGTGLGLAITHKSVIMHHGEIKVSSVVGEGTTFNVRIPSNYIAREENYE